MKTDMGNALHEIFLAGEDLGESDGLLWRSMLRETSCAYTPTLLGPEEREFKIVREGQSDLVNGIVSMQEIMDNFHDGAKEHVQVILGAQKKDPLTRSGGEHEAITKNNQGFVRKLKIIEKDGVSHLAAGLDITEPETKEKMERGTYAGVSAGIKPVLNKGTGKRYDAALHHLAITNDNWVPGAGEELGEAILAADDSDETDSVVEVNLGPFDEGEDITGEVVWDERNSLDWRRTQVQAQLGVISKDTGLRPEDRTYYYVRDISPEQALVVEEGGENPGDTFVIPYEIKGDDAVLAPTARWTKTRAVMVAAADELDDDQLGARIKNALSYQLNLGDNYEVVDTNTQQALVKDKISGLQWAVGYDLSDDQIWLDHVEDWTKAEELSKPKSVIPQQPAPTRAPEANLADEDFDLSTPRGRVAAARARRAEQSSNDNNRGGSNMAKDRKSTLNLDGLDLSDETREELERRTAEITLSDDEREELRKRRASDAKRDREEKVEAWKEIIPEDNPGVLRYINHVYLSDQEQEPAGILLADDELGIEQEQEVTLSGVLDGLFNLLKKQSKRIELADTGLVDGPKPANNADDETQNERSLDEQLAEAADVLKLPTRTPVNRLG